MCRHIKIARMPAPSFCLRDSAARATLHLRHSCEILRSFLRTRSPPWIPDTSLGIGLIVSRFARFVNTHFQLFLIFCDFLHKKGIKEWILVEISLKFAKKADFIQKNEEKHIFGCRPPLKRRHRPPPPFLAVVFCCPAYYNKNEISTKRAQALDFTAYCNVTI